MLFYINSICYTKYRPSDLYFFWKAENKLGLLLGRLVRGWVGLTVSIGVIAGCVHVHHFTVFVFSLVSLNGIVGSEALLVDEQSDCDCNDRQQDDNPEYNQGYTSLAAVARNLACRMRFSDLRLSWPKCLSSEKLKQQTLVFFHIKLQ